MCVGGQDQVLQSTDLALLHTQCRTVLARQDLPGGEDLMQEGYLCGGGNLPACRTSALLQEGKTGEGTDLMQQGLPSPICGGEDLMQEGPPICVS